MRNKEINRLDFVMAKTSITKENIDDYEIYGNRRKIRQSQVRELLKALRNKDSFPPISVNIKGNKKYILDGNHRYEAIRTYLEKDGTKVEIWEMQFHIGDSEKEKETFIAINNVIKASSDDMLCLFQDEEFIVKLMKKNPSVSVYGSNSRPVKLRPLLAAYFLAKSKKHKTDSITALDMVKFIKEGKEEDITIITAFLKDYSVIFGNLVLKNNIWLRTTLLTALFRIWYQNRNISLGDMINRLRVLINHPYTIEFAKLGGREASFICASRFVEIINNHRGEKFKLETLV